MTQQEMLQICNSPAVLPARFSAGWDVPTGTLELDLHEYAEEQACLWVVHRGNDYVAGGKIDHPLDVASLVAVRELSLLAAQEATA